MPDIFRAATDVEPGKVKKPYFSSRRVPKNVPYLVDNIWAWTRPDEYPDRRTCAYGSLSPEQAEESGEGDAYRVRFQGDHTICQVVGHPDAKKHPDVREIEDAVHNLLGKYDWSNQPMNEKVTAGRLYMPVLTDAEVQEVLERVGLARRELASLRDAVQFWEDTEIVEEGDFPGTVGEIFFEYPDGYVLEPVDA